METPESKAGGQAAQKQQSCDKKASGGSEEGKYRARSCWKGNIRTEIVCKYTFYYVLSF